jgi:phosphate transport system substrate-binding protein
MKISRIVSIVLSIGLLTSTTPAQAADALSGKGSSFAFNAISTCTARYSGGDITYTSTGSGTGRTEFANRNIDWAVSDMPYTSNYPQFDYVTMPLFGGPVAFAYSAVGVRDGLQLTPVIVSKILKGQITMWNDQSIVKANPRTKLPNKTIKVAYRSSGSGTTANLTDYLSQTVGGWTKGSNDLMVASGNSLSKNSTSFATSALLAGYIEDNSNAFGYFDLSDAITADVGIAKLKNAAGVYVAPTPSSASRFIDGQKLNRNGTISINFKKVIPGAYQLSIVTYGLAPKRPASQKVSTGKGLAVQKWFNYVVSACIPSRAASLGYAPLGNSMKRSALNIIKTIG